MTAVWQKMPGCGRSMQLCMFVLFYTATRFAGSSDANFAIMDEFGKRTTLPYDKGAIIVDNCEWPHVKNTDPQVNVTSPINIPADSEKLGATHANKPIAIDCYQGTTVHIASGLVRRITDGKQCPTQSVICGDALKTVDDGKPLRMCFKDGPKHPTTTECEWFLLQQNPAKFEQAYMQMHHENNIVCQHINFKFTDVSGLTKDLPPGYMLLLDKTSRVAGVNITTDPPMNLTCNGLTQTREKEYFGEGEILTVTMKTWKGRLMRVQCRTVGQLPVHTYFVMGDGVMWMNCTIATNPVCMAPTWLRSQVDKSNVEISTATDGHACSLPLKVCYPDDRHVVLNGRCKDGEEHPPDDPQQSDDDPQQLDVDDETKKPTHEEVRGPDPRVILGIFCLLLICAALYACIQYSLDTMRKKQAQPQPPIGPVVGASTAGQSAETTAGATASGLQAEKCAAIPQAPTSTAAPAAPQVATSAAAPAAPQAATSAAAPAGSQAATYAAAAMVAKCAAAAIAEKYAAAPPATARPIPSVSAKVKTTNC